LLVRWSEKTRRGKDTDEQAALASFWRALDLRTYPPIDLAAMSAWRSRELVPTDKAGYQGHRLTFFRDGLVIGGCADLVLDPRNQSLFFEIELLEREFCGLGRVFTQIQRVGC
jgi:hypothetical protein